MLMGYSSSNRNNTQSQLSEYIYNKRKPFDDFHDSLLHVQAAKYWNPTAVSRRLPLAGPGEEPLLADFLWNSSTGSFWLPRPPPPDTLIGGYEIRKQNFPEVFFHPEEYGKAVYNSTVGFVGGDFVNIFMSETFNAGDFLAYFVSPVIAGRLAELRTAEQGNLVSLNVVGSTLQWGLRYNWGPGFMYNSSLASPTTEVVFATRGPHTYNAFMKSPELSPVSKVNPVFGDVGSLLSWFYQPHDQSKKHSLCLIPHYADDRRSFVKRIKEWWNGTYHILNILDPLFDIVDGLVQCEFVLSSSLHGLIFSDSYGIPNAHMKYLDSVGGGAFKFNDYFASAKRTRETLDMADEAWWTRPGEVARFAQRQKESYDPSGIHMMPYWRACPMHAEAYNRTREEHVAFARRFVEDFHGLLEDRPESMIAFHRSMRRKMGGARAY